MASPPELCDHSDCPAKALVAYTRGYLELTFCRHHANLLESVLRSDDWERVSDPEVKR